MTRHLTPVVVAISVAGLGATAPALAQQESPWSGFYLGGNIGGSWGHASLSRSLTTKNGTQIIPPADAQLLNSTNNGSNNGGGVTGGIEGGYNWSIGGGWVLGVETDFAAIDTGTTYSKTVQSPVLTVPPVTYHLSSESAADWMWTLRPRLGYSFGSLMIYGTGGLAIANLNMSGTVYDTRTPPNNLHAARSGVEEGWAAGGGMAYAFTPNWSMKVEYLYADFGSFSETASGRLANLTIDSKARPQLFRVGVDYRFGGASEPVATAPYVPPPVQPPAPAPKSYLVFFEFNKSDLTPQATEIVDTAAKNVVEGRVTQLTVTGHTDTVGSDAYNMRLSKRRAESVSQELQAKGVPSSEISVVAKGKRDLLVPTGDGVREPQNRRVQIVFGEGSTS